MEAGRAVAEAAVDQILARPLFNETEVPFGEFDRTSFAGSRTSRVGKAQKPLAPDKWELELQSTKTALGVAAATNPADILPSILTALKDPAGLEEWYLGHLREFALLSEEDVIRPLARLAMAATAYVAWKGRGHTTGATAAPAPQQEEAPPPTQVPSLQPGPLAAGRYTSKSSALSFTLNGFLVVRSASIFTLSKESPHHLAMLQVLSDAHEACAGQRLCWALVSLAQRDGSAGEYDECTRRLRSFSQNDSLRSISIEGFPRHQIISLLAGMVAGVVARNREISKTVLPLKWPLRVVAAVAFGMIMANNPIPDGTLDRDLMTSCPVPGRWHQRRLEEKPLASFWVSDVSVLNAAKDSDSKKLTKLWQSQMDVLTARVAPGRQDSRSRSRSRSGSRHRRDRSAGRHRSRSSSSSSSSGSSSGGSASGASRGGGRASRRRSRRASAPAAAERRPARSGARSGASRGASAAVVTARQKTAAFLAAGKPPVGGGLYELQMCPDGRARWYPHKKKGNTQQRRT
jgi:uncharacterized membrane protein YgcG